MLLIGSLRRSFYAYMKHPFIFIWGSLVYLLMLAVFFMAAVGFFIIYFMLSSMLNVPIGPDQIPTMVVGAFITIDFMYFLGGLSAGLFMTYNKALTKNKTSLAEFYGYALHKAPTMFGVLVIREFLTLLVLGPVIALYVVFLSNIEYMDYMLYAYILFWVFVLHFLFTPAFIGAGAFGYGLFPALNHAFSLIRKRHVNYLGLFILFAIVWFLNFVPLVQLVTLFFLYPILVTALVSMMAGGSAIAVKETRAEEEDSDD